MLSLFRGAAVISFALCLFPHLFPICLGFEVRPSRSQPRLCSRSLCSAGKFCEKTWALKSSSSSGFYDTCRLSVKGGSGGNGCVAFRREKGKPKGGPSGGRGGKGGSVKLLCNGSLGTLSKARNSVHVRGEDGDNGEGAWKNGKMGRDVVVEVPLGTVVKDSEGKVAGELNKDGEVMVVSCGGRGGRGNAAFKTHTNTAPKLAEKGGEGHERWINLEMKIVGEVGVVGMPNAGKSTLLGATTNANPKTASYPFTTISPNIGVVNLEDGKDLVMVDIPGLIEGASDGKGMGISFLRHVQRNKVLLHVVDCTAEDPVGDFRKINAELAKFDEELGRKAQVVALNKADLGAGEGLVEEIKEEAKHDRVMVISAKTGQSVRELMHRLKKFVEAQPEVVLSSSAPTVRFDIASIDADPESFKVSCDPAYPGEWQVEGSYIEEVARMTHWQYPEAVERFGRVFDAIGLSKELQSRGAEEGDYIMIGDFEFDFSPSKTNPYIPKELLDKDIEIEQMERLSEMEMQMWNNVDMEEEEEEEEDFDLDEEDTAS